MTSNQRLPYGWKDFDQSVVRAIRTGRVSAIDRAATGGLVCPFLNHQPGYECKLFWNPAGYEEGTIGHGDPEVSFRVSTTYIYKNAIDNFVVGHDLVREALRGNWGKAEVGRLGYENSEDALSWNVFRSLQEADALPVAIEMLTGLQVNNQEIELYCWGRKIRIDGSEPWPEFKNLRDKFEPGLSTQTEPDICLRVRGSAWIFIEAKFSSKTTMFHRGDVAKRQSWIERYRPFAADVFDLDHLSSAEPHTIPAQLLRNVLFAKGTSDGTGEQAIVVGLVRDQDGPLHLKHHVQPFLAQHCRVRFETATWESLYQVLPASLGTLRSYLQNKSVSLRPAFKIDLKTTTPA